LRENIKNTGKAGKRAGIILEKKCAEEDAIRTNLNKIIDNIEQDIVSFIRKLSITRSITKKNFIQT
jgi:hypothetical protein